MKWRYAVKKFEEQKKIPPPLWNALEECLVLTPSSYGLQPWKFLVITEPTLKEKLLPLSWNQKQVVDCSHYVVFLAKTDITETDIDRFIARTCEVRHTAVESLAGYKKMMMTDLVSGPRHATITHWATNQIYLALGNLLTSAAVLGVDACPMEGLEPEKYDKVLNVQDSGYATRVACALGYRAENDKHARSAKVRFKKEDVLVLLK